MTHPLHIGSLALGEGMPKICVPLTGETKEALLQQAEGAKKAGADLAEWRADLCAGLSWDEEGQETLRTFLPALKEALQAIPLLFTIRTVKEGGQGALTEEAYEGLNLLAAKSGCASLVDVEALQEKERKKAHIAQLQAAGVAVIASCHDFEKTDPREILKDRYLLLEESGADILKMAVMPKCFDDVAALMQVTDEVRRTMTGRPLIAMAMGQTGMISRISGESFGSCLTFGTLGEASAPGQLPIADLRRMLEAFHRSR